MTSVTRAPAAPDWPASEVVLSVRGLRTRFHTPDGVVHAVNGVDLDVRPGETLAIVGESGSGKSVSMLSVMGLVPTPPAEVSGSVVFDGRELVGLKSQELRSLRGNEMAMVFQDPMSSLNPVHSVGSQIGEALRIHRGAGAREAREAALEMLQRVGIPDPRRRIDDYPHQFSGGMRQRVMIAMALACGPKLLIADEPTTALDVTIQAQIVDLVRDLRRDFGMAVVWITHDLGVVADLADRVAVMYAGRVVEQGTVDEIYASTRHPYTMGLLRSVPRLGETVPVKLEEIPGAPPDMRHDVAHCAFAPRCPFADHQSMAARPPLEAADQPDHLVACWHWRELAAAGVADRPLPELQQRTAATTEPLLEVRDLRTHFPIHRGIFGRQAGVVRAVDGVDLSIPAGTTLGLVGESGCGKTTLGRTVMRLETPTAGQLRFDGADITRASGSELRAVRRRMQMIFQDPYSSMNPGMRVGDIVAEPLRIHRLGNRREISERVGELLQRVGLTEGSAARYPHEFSGGQRQRIVIARALALGPSLIVCDEPVSALDVSVQAQIINLLGDLQRDLGVTYLFIAHDLAVVKHISHEVAVMYLGKVVERAPRDAIYARPLHPYTDALLKSVPEPDPGEARRRERRVLQGDLPSPANPPSGCRFNTRCPMAREGICNVEEPPLRELEPHHFVACHFAEELQARLTPLPVFQQMEVATGNGNSASRLEARGGEPT
jgi:peptide/nickel transport system ATP-binding protein